MSTLMAEHGAPVHLILGAGDLALLLVLMGVNVSVGVRGAFHELGVMLALMIGFFASGHARLYLQEDPAALGFALGLVAAFVTVMMALEARRAGQAWAHAAQIGFGLLSAVVGIVIVLLGGPSAHLPAGAHIPSYFALACVLWGLWTNRRVKAWSEAG